MSLASSTASSIAKPIARSLVGVADGAGGGGPAAATFQFLASANAANATTDAIDTTGAKLLIAVGASFSVAGTFTDSKGNTWTVLPSQTAGVAYVCNVAYCINPTVGSGHTFSFSGAYNSFRVLAFSATGDIEFGASDGDAIADPGTSLSPGSVTPTENNSLVIAALAWGAAGGPASVSGGMVLAQSPYVDNVSIPEVTGYLLQTVAAAFTPTFTFPSSIAAATVAYFTVA
jgi:hypothetical protein